MVHLELLHIVIVWTINSILWEFQLWNTESSDASLVETTPLNYINLSQVLCVLHIIERMKGPMPLSGCQTIPNLFISGGSIELTLSVCHIIIFKSLSILFHIIGLMVERLRKTKTLQSNINNQISWNWPAYPLHSTSLIEISF